MPAFIPAIWSAKILEALDNNLVYSKLFNTDYQGEITNVGDTVHIGTVNNVTVKKYTRNTDIEAETIAVTDQTLVIDQADYFNIIVDSLDEVQSKLPLLNEATQRAAYGFSDATDKHLGSIAAAKGTANANLGTKAAPLTITKENAYETLVQMRLNLNKANLPTAGRVCIVPPEFESLMLLDPHFVAVGTDASNDRLEGGTVYRAAGFEISVSNNAPTVAKAGEMADKTAINIVAGSPMCGTFANQILNTESYKPEKRFGDGVKGLHAYGATITRPAAVAVATVVF